MNTQELKNDSSIPETDEKMDGKIGIGLNEFTEKSVTDVSAFDSKKCSIKKLDFSGEYSYLQLFVSSQQELHELVEKKRGLTVNFGFGSLGHHKSTIHEKAISKKSLNLFIKSEREAIPKKLDLPNDEPGNNGYCAEANGYITKGEKENFYAKFGSQYTSQSKTGYFMHALIIFECNSEEELESKKKDFEATFTNDDVTGKGSLSSNKKFTNFCESNKGAIRVSHNIPPELISSILNYDDMSDLKKVLALRDRLEKFPMDGAGIMDHELSNYPLSPDFFRNFNNVETEIGELGKQLENSQEELDTIKEYEDKNRNFMYEKVPDIQQRKDFHTKRVSDSQKLAKLLSDNPWAANDEINHLKTAIAAKAPDKLILRTAAINCVTSNGLFMSGSMNLGTAECSLPLVYTSFTGMGSIRDLGILLNIPVKPSDLSIHYSLVYQVPDKKTLIPTASATGQDGTIIHTTSELNKFYPVTSVKVWLTGVLAKMYTINLSVSTTKSNILTNQSSNSETGAIIETNINTLTEISLIAVYLSPKKG